MNVYGRHGDEGYTITIVDTGIGMSEEDIERANERLSCDRRLHRSHRRATSVTTSSRSSRCGTRSRSTLEPSPSAGVTAAILLPFTLLDDGLGAPIDQMPEDRSVLVRRHRAAGRARRARRCTRTGRRCESAGAGRCRRRRPARRSRLHRRVPPSWSSPIRSPKSRTRPQSRAGCVRGRSRRGRNARVRRPDAAAVDADVVEPEVAAGLGLRRPRRPRRRARTATPTHGFAPEPGLGRAAARRPSSRLPPLAPRRRPPRAARPAVRADDVRRCRLRGRAACRSREATSGAGRRAARGRRAGRARSRPGCVRGDAARDGCRADPEGEGRDEPLVEPDGPQPEPVQAFVSNQPDGAEPNVGCARVARSSPRRSRTTCCRSSRAAAGRRDAVPETPAPAVPAQVLRIAASVSPAEPVAEPETIVALEQEPVQAAAAGAPPLPRRELDAESGGTAAACPGTGRRRRCPKRSRSTELRIVRCVPSSD